MISHWSIAPEPFL
ncbi:hypothetical protein VCCP10303_2545, partial [Vibrio cholerae CP1030(3)]